MDVSELQKTGKDQIIEFPMCLPGPSIFHHILLYLSAIDIGRLMQASRTLKIWITSDSVLWRIQCQRVWLCDDKRDEESWHDKWLSCCDDWRPYMNCYAKIKSTWIRISQFLQLKCPKALEQFNPGISEKEIKHVETALGIKLPVEYRCFLRLCNGMKYDHGISFLGSVTLYNTTFEYILYCIDDMKEFSKGIHSDLFVSHNSGQMEYYACLGGDLYGRCGWFLLSCSSQPHELSGHVYQVNSYLYTYAKPLLFSDWLIEQANLLELYSIDNQAIHRFLFHPEFIAVTGHFTVRVGTAFDPAKLNDYTHVLVEQSGNVDVRYAYRIEIFMADDAPRYESCRLESRHWLIKLSDGTSDVVDGPGVVGETPSFKPGSSHKYASCNYFHTEWCSMEGYFTMRYHDFPGNFKIAIPKFTMYKPELNKVA
ncbi:F-box only protein 3-like [Dysidea avara]|uniref:F-box only protein 3-like n=1 Tax=Dysidea avara TaxID=196820 RepID=UPI003323E95E